MATVLKPASAMPAAKLALVVVFPTPPLPDVTTITFAIRTSPYAELQGGGLARPFTLRANMALRVCLENGCSLRGCSCPRLAIKPSKGGKRQIFGCDFAYLV